MEHSKRQKEIIQASLDIISSDGIQSLTIKNLSKKIHVTEGALYRHFRSKTDILFAIADFFEEHSTGILNDIVLSDISGLKKVKTFFLGRCRQFSENRGLVLVLFSQDIFKNDQQLIKKIHGTISQHRNLLMQALDEGKEAGDIRNDIKSEHLFVVIMGALRLLTTQWRGGGFQFDLVKRGEELFQSIKKMMSR